MLVSSPRVQEGMVWFRSGHFYNFHYTQYANDPIPTVVMLNWVHGSHPNTGHKHNYIQCINLSYIPRNYRKKFVDAWLPTLTLYKGDTRLTWKKIVSRWPFMQMAIRRYIIKKNYIKYAKEIPPNNVNDFVISTWLRDYSKMAMKQLVVLTDRMRERNPNARKNVFAKSLSKYLYKYNTSR